MSKTVIKVEDVSKMYRIGKKIQSDTLFEKALNIVKAPIHNLKNIGGLTRFKENEDTSFWALRDINFEVNEGDVLGIVGHNGAGKSTLLKILSRITEPTRGKITLNGRVSALLEVGTGFHPELTGRDNVYMNGTILGMRRREIDEKIDEIIHFSGIEKHLDTPVKFYSSGMRVRLAFSVAAHLEPEILIIDEVLAVGDAEFQKKCLGKMESVAVQGRTVLFVSHNMGAVSNLCSKAMILNAGQIAYESTNVKNALEKYENLIFKSFDEEISNEEKLEEGSIDGFRLKKFQVTSLSDGHVRSGDDIEISIDFIVSKKFISPAFVIQVMDHLGVEVIRLSTKPISGFEIENLENKNKISLVIRNLPLVAGKYYVDFGFVRQGFEWLSKVEKIAILDVDKKDVYKSGLELDRSRGLIWVDHEWNIK